MNTLGTLIAGVTAGAVASKAAPAGITSAHAPLRIGTVALTVRRLEEVSGFYQDVIGLKLIDTKPGLHRLGAGGRVLLDLRHDPGAAIADPRDAGLFHLAFLLPTRADLADWIVHATETGVRLQGASDHLVSEALYLADPEGNGVEIYHDRASQEWTLDGSGRVKMATLRLDMHGLVKAASGRPFTGLPDGTIVGHVHLQVGDLRAAETFYSGLVGLEVACYYPGATFMGAGGYHHHIATNTWNSQGASKRPARTTGLAEVGFVGEPAALASIAGKLQAPPADRSGPRMTTRDPWGTELSFVPA